MLAGTDEELAKVVRIALQFPVTQVSVESVFSSLKYVLIDLRMRFGNHELDVLISTLNQVKSKERSSRPRRCPNFHSKSSEEQKKSSRPRRCPNFLI